MYLNRKAIILTIALLWLSSPVFGQMPGEVQIQSDLATIYAAHQATPQLTGRGELCRALEPHLIKQSRYFVSLMKPWSTDPAASLITSGVNTEYGIRPNAHAASTLAIVARCITDGYPSDFSQEIAKAKSISLLRFLLATHGAGGKMCTNGKQWKDQWQSAHWAASAGRAIWLLWDDLDPQLKWLGARMICDEADRFIHREPDHRVTSNTAAEENAWNSEIISLAYNMFPNHPRHALYGSTAQLWQISSFMTSFDTKSHEIVDGKAVRDWFGYPNIYDDYTLENHDRVHPDYMCCIGTNLHQSTFYHWGNNPVPLTCLFNAPHIYDVLRWFQLPDGGMVYPSGQDWSLHRMGDWMYNHVAMSVIFNDKQAATNARHCLATLLANSARNPNAGTYDPNENRFPSGEGLSGEWPAMAYLLMAHAGEGPAPLSDTEEWKTLTGVRIFDKGRFGLLRTEHSIASFSWGNIVMGQVYPLRKDLLCTPNERTLIGIIDFDGKVKDEPKISQINILPLKDTLAVAGTIDRGNGKAQQRFAFVALPDGRTIYVDHLQFIENTRPRALELGTLGILNDANWPHHKPAERVLTYASGRTTFKAASAINDAPVDLASPWYNIDGMGILVFGKNTHQKYFPKPTGADGRLEQLFHLNHPADLSNPAPTMLIFYPEQTAEQTQTIYPKVTWTNTDLALHNIQLEDGKMITIDLDKLTILIH